VKVVTLTPDTRIQCMKLFQKRILKAAKEGLSPYPGDAKMKIIVAKAVETFESECSGFETAKHSYSIVSYTFLRCFFETAKLHGLNTSSMCEKFKWLRALKYIEFGNGCDLYLKYRFPVKGIKRMCKGRFWQETMVDYEELGRIYPWGLSSKRSN
jgi:hypothetical protein